MAKSKDIIITRAALDVLSDMSDVQAGQLFKAIRLYEIAASLSEQCVPIERILDKTCWQDGDLDILIRDIQQYTRNAWVRMAFKAIKSQIDDKMFPEPKQPSKPRKKKEEKLRDMEEKKAEFSEILDPYYNEGVYEKERLDQFYDYWTKPSSVSKYKMKFETEKDWNLNQRIDFWMNKFKPQQETIGRESISSKRFEKF